MCIRDSNNIDQYSWDTNYIGWNNYINYSFLSQKQFLDISIKGGLGIATIINGKQQMGGQIFDLKYNNEETINKRKQILVFDISPSNTSNCCEYINYTSFVNIKKYLKDICQSIYELKPDVDIKLKIKKDLNIVAVQGYAEVVGLDVILKKYKNFLRELCDEYDNLSIINNQDVDIISEIRKSACCISMPYSSSLLLSSFFKKKSIIKYIKLKKNKFDMTDIENIIE